MRVDGRNGKVAFLVARLVAQIGTGAGGLAVESAFRCVAGLPLSLAGLDAVVAVVHARVVGDPVEDEELRFRPEVGDVADAARLEVPFRLLRDEARIARVGFPGDRIDDVADEREGLVPGERVHRRGVGMGIHPRMDDPSNPSPSSNTTSVNSARGTVKCCQRPMKSMNFRSTITAFLSCAYPITSFAFGMVVASRAPRGGAHKFCACYRTLDVQAVDRTPRVALYIFVYFALDAPLVNH